MKRSRVRAWRAEPAWIVVKPLTPDDSVSSSGSASRSRTSPTMATSGAMRRKPATSRRRSTAGRSERAGRVCMLRDVRQRDVGLEDLLGDDDPQRRVELGGAARQQRGLARPGRRRRTRSTAGPARTRAGTRPPARVSMSRATSSSRLRNGDAGELADVHDHVAAAADVAVDDVQAGAVVELRVLEALGGVELAVRAGGVVEDLREGADDVVVVVEDLVVVAGCAPVALHEDRVGGVDHDLPHVVVVEQRLRAGRSRRGCGYARSATMSGSARSKARRPRR